MANPIYTAYEQSSTGATSLTLEKTLMLGGIGGRRRRGRQDEMVASHHRSMDMGLGKLWELGMGREAWRAVIHGLTKSWTRLSD